MMRERTNPPPPPSIRQILLQYQLTKPISFLDLDSYSRKVWNKRVNERARSEGREREIVERVPKERRQKVISSDII